MRCGITEILVCTNRQMLRGKLGRSLGHEAPARDLYDAVVAGRLDPRFLAEGRIAAGRISGPRQRGRPTNRS